MRLLKCLEFSRIILRDKNINYLFIFFQLAIKMHFIIGILAGYKSKSQSFINTMNLNIVHNITVGTDIERSKSICNKLLYM